MKKVSALLLAVLLILPMAVACSTGPKGDPVEVPNVTVVSYKGVETEVATGEVATEENSVTTFYTGSVTAYVEEGALLTVKDVLDGYARDLDSTAHYDEDTGCYNRFHDILNSDGWFWNVYVNGAEARMDQEVKAATDKIEIRYEK